MKTVGIIGGSGFIGSHVTKRFLEEGYKVKVSTTDISKKDKYSHLAHLAPAGTQSENLEILPLKLENLSELKTFAAGCDIMIHGGTPFKLDFKDAQTELFDPTIKGTANFLDVISETPGIEKVVFIASVAGYNTNFPLPPNGKSANATIDENSKRFISPESHPYAQAKFIANQWVEKYIDSHPKLRFEITSVSPVMVMGRSLSKREDSTSTGMQFLIKNQIAPNDFMQAMYDTDMPLAIVDVEDVAEAIYLAATKRGLHGKDYLLSSETFRVSDVRAMLNNLPPKFNSEMVYLNQLAKADLSAKFRPVADTLRAYSY